MRAPPPRTTGRVRVGEPIKVERQEFPEIKAWDLAARPTQEDK